jgi:hypothetical protein
MSNFDPIFIPISKLNNDKKCVTSSLLNFTGNIHYTPDGVLICAAEYNGLEEDLEQAFNSFGLGESNRQLIRGIVLPKAGTVTVGIINEEETIAVTAATAAAAAADGLDDNEGVVGEEESSSGDEDNIDKNDDEDDEEEGDTVTELPSSKIQFDSDDDSYDEDQQFSQQASFFS